MDTKTFDGPGALLKFAWNILTKHWKSVGLVIWIPYAVSAVLQLVIFGIVFSGGGVSAMIGASFILLIVSIIVWVFSIAAVPASIQAVHRVATDPGTPITLKAQYRFGFSLFWSVLLLGIIQGLVGFGSFALLIIPGIVVAVYGCLYAYTLVIDGKKGFSALTESFLLVRGRWWPVFGRVIILVLVVAAIVLVLGLIQYLLSLIFGFSLTSGIPSFGRLLVQTIVSLISTAIIYPLGLGYTYAMYSSLRKTYVADAAAKVSTFKGWLIAFLVIGILAIVGMITIVPAIAILSARSRLGNMQGSYQQNMMQLQQQMNQQNLDMIKSGTNIPVQQ